jgi:hypothetical protein
MSYQRAVIWGKLVREIMFGPVLRDATDWELGSDLDVIGTGANGEIDASGGTVYGVLVDSISDTASEGLVFLVADSTDQTLTAETGLDSGAGELGSDAEEFFMVQIPTASAATAPQIHGWVIPNGLVCATNIQLMADTTAGTAMTTNDVRAHVVYRSGTEVRV